MSMKKIPLTPAGIEPATFRFAAQHLNHCATTGPQLCNLAGTKYEFPEDDTIVSKRTEAVQIGAAQ